MVKLNNLTRNIGARLKTERKIVEKPILKISPIAGSKINPETKKSGEAW